MADIRIPSKDSSTFSGYFAAPHGGRGPGILVIQEIFGVNQGMRQLCDLWAERGYAALCPDLFWRQEPNVQLTDQTEAEWAKAFQLYQGFDVDKGVQDLITALDVLRQRPECDGKVGTIGYCLGGKLSYLMATRSSVDAAVGYYGVGIEDLLGEASHIKKPLLMHIAEKDKFVSPSAQAQIKKSLEKNLHVTLFTYEGQDHAFARPGGAHYNADAASLANQRTADFMAKNLGRS